MDNPNEHATPEGSAKPIAIKIFGVGNAGLTLIAQLAKGALPNAPLVAVNTDAKSVNASGAPEKISLGVKAGGDPQRAKVAAEEQMAKLKAACAGADAVFIVA